MTLQLEGDRATLRQALAARSERLVALPSVRCKLLDYQMLALYLLARRYDRPGAHLLDIGTGAGASAFLLAQGARQARIVSLTTSAADATAAERFWRSQGCATIEGRIEASWDYLARIGGVWDLVFVDGDHNRVARDLLWFDRLREGGLLLCHDYSPADSAAPSAIVYAELNALAARLGRPFDVRLVDERRIGMAGFYRRAGERIGPEVAAAVAEIVQTVEGSGIVLRTADDGLRRRAAAHGLQVYVDGDDWRLRWTRTLFVGAGVAVPWDLVRIGFELLAKWDVAVPFTRETVLADEIGTADERARTQRLLHDLRIPVYTTDLIFVRASAAGRALVENWRREAADGGDERLAFLRALAAVKPIICALPRSWVDGSWARDPRRR